jgi:hypothetical protein
MEEFKSKILDDEPALKRVLTEDDDAAEPNGTMDDYWKVHDISKDVNHGLSDLMEEKIKENLDMNEGRYGDPERYKNPLIIRFQLYMLMQVDNNQRNVLFIACKHGLHVVTKFLVEMAMELQA